MLDSMTTKERELMTKHTEGLKEEMKLSLFRGILSFIRKEVVKLKVSQNRENERKQQKGSCFVRRITAFSFMASPLNNANILPSLLQWVSAKTTSEGHWNRWGVKHIHVHTDIHTHTICDTLCGRALHAKRCFWEQTPGLIQRNKNCHY